jgi:rod shape-determining protein MreD
MNWFKFTLWTYLVFVLHSSLAASLAIAGSAPQLVLAGWILVIRRMPPRQGLLAAALWGLLADCQTNGRLGAGIVCLSISTWILQRCLGRRNDNSLLTLVVLSSPLIWADIVGMAVLRGLSDGHSVNMRAQCIQAAGSAIYTGIIVVAAEIASRYVRGNAEGDAAIGVPAVLNRWKMLTD